MDAERLEAERLSLSAEIEQKAKADEDRLSALRLRVTRFDALRQCLEQQHRDDFDEKAICTLNEMVFDGGYCSDTLLLSAERMALASPTLNQSENAQFIGSFLRDRQCTFNLFLLCFRTLFHRQI